MKTEFYFNITETLKRPLVTMFFENGKSATLYDAEVKASLNKTKLKFVKKFSDGTKLYRRK